MVTCAQMVPRFIIPYVNIDEFIIIKVIIPPMSKIHNQQKTHKNKERVTKMDKMSKKHLFPFHTPKQKAYIPCTYPIYNEKELSM